MVRNIKQKSWLYLKLIAKRVTYQNFKSNLQYSWPIFIFGLAPILFLYIYIIYYGSHFYEQVNTEILYSTELKNGLKGISNSMIQEGIIDIAKYTTIAVVVYVILNLINDSNINNKFKRKLHIYQAVSLSLLINYILLMFLHSVTLDQNAYFMSKGFNNGVEINCLLTPNCSKQLIIEYNKGVRNYSEHKNAILMSFEKNQRMCANQHKKRDMFMECLNQAESSSSSSNR